MTWQAVLTSLELLEKDAVLGDLALDLTIGRARDAQTDRTAGAMTRQTNHAHIVAKVLA
jgi:hypothetical protein